MAESGSTCCGSCSQRTMFSGMLAITAPMKARVAMVLRWLWSTDPGPVRSEVEIGGPCRSR